MKRADLTTYYIEGFTRKEGLTFSLPLYSHIDGNLWMGGCPIETAPEEFEFLVCLDPWKPYKINQHQIYIKEWLNDSSEIPDETKLYALAECVNRYRSHGVTLVHCQAGLNRSGLVIALAMIESGTEPIDAIAMLRNKRSPEVLCNKAFERWLLTRGKNPAIGM